MTHKRNKNCVSLVGNELFVSHGGGWQFVGQLDTKFPSLVSPMVNLLRGVFITCDIPMKQFILKLDEDQAPNRFVIANLDETSWALKFVQDKLEELYEENYYQPEY